MRVWNFSLGLTPGPDAGSLTPWKHLVGVGSLVPPLGVLQRLEWVRQASQNPVVQEGRGKGACAAETSTGLCAWESRGGCACSQRCMKPWCLCPHCCVVLYVCFIETAGNRV